MSHRWMTACAALTAAALLAMPALSFAQATKTAPKAAAKAGAARTIQMQGLDTLKFQPAAITAKPGETIRVVLTVKSMMPKAAMAHNFVLLAPKADINAFVMAAARARTTDYIPAANKADILASTGLAGAGETVEVTFTAPKTPGVYTFICTFPAHYQGGMKGTLTVK
jgi:azurin